jgi:hypothetical protein
MPPDQNMLPVKREPIWDLVVHCVLFAVSVVLLYFGIIGAGMAGDAPRVLEWTLPPLGVGAALAIWRRRWTALATHGTLVVINLVLFLVLI